MAALYVTQISHFNPRQIWLVNVVGSKLAVHLNLPGIDEGHSTPCWPFTFQWVRAENWESVFKKPPQVILRFSFVGWGFEYLKVGQPHPVSLPLLYGCKAWTSNLQLFIHSLNIYWVLTINILFYKERTTGNKKWNKSVWLDQKYSYWTHPLSHHNFLLNLRASAFALEMVQKRINVWRLQNKTAWSQILVQHLIRWLGQVTPQF